MLSWLRSLPRVAKIHKSTRKGRQNRFAWGAKLEAQHFRVERLEERRLLAVDVGVSLLFPPAPVSTIGSQTFAYRVTNNDSTAATSGLTFADVYSAPAGTTVNINDDALRFGPGIDYVSGTAIPFTLGPGETAYIDVSFQATTPGTLISTASVYETGDTDSSNNTAGPSAVTTTSAKSSGVGGYFLESDPGDGTPATEITNLYWNILGRTPDTAGEQSWIAYGNVHPGAAGLQAIVSGFLNSSEYKTNYVTAVYDIFLGRLPEVGGLGYWTDKLGSPGTPGLHGGSADEREIVAAILGSNEYYANAGGTPQGWISALYDDVLGRSPDGNDMSFWQHELALRGPADRDGIARDLLSSPETAHDLLDAFYPAPGGTSGHPLPLPGQPAGRGGDKLAMLTGGGWENLYLAGPWAGGQEADDGFYTALASGASWDDVQYLMLTSPQYLDSANHPATTPITSPTMGGNYTFGAYSGAVTLTIQEVAGAAVSGEITFARLGAATFSGTANGNNGLTGSFTALPNGPSQFNLTINRLTGTIAGTTTGVVDGRTVTGVITTA